MVPIQPSQQISAKILKKDGQSVWIPRTPYLRLTSIWQRGPGGNRVQVAFAEYPL